MLISSFSLSSTNHGGKQTERNIIVGCILPKKKTKKVESRNYFKGRKIKKKYENFFNFHLFNFIFVHKGVCVYARVY